MSSRFVLPTLLLAAVTALLWLSYGFAGSHQLFGSHAVSTVFRVAAVLASAALFIVVGAHVVVRLGFAWLLQYEPTQLQRGLVSALLGFIAAGAALAYFGFDLGPILTASALLSAIIGLSAQPLLGSLMSGLSLHRLIRIGDGVLLNGEQVRITSLNWRSVVATRPDGSAVIVPNARLADSTLEVLPHDRSTRAEVVVELPAALAPHRARKLVTGLIDDFPEVDDTQPITVLPQKSPGGGALASYRACFWVSRYAVRADVEGRVLRRCWYAFRREGVAAPAEAPGHPPADLARETLLSAVCAALRTPRGRSSVGDESPAAAVIASGVQLLYDAGERIVLPERLAGRFCILVDGQLAQIDPDGETFEGAQKRLSAGNDGDLSRTASLARIERALAARIGPYAAPLVARASVGGAGLSAICTAVAQEIDDPRQREGFLREASPPAQQTRGPGFLFRCQRDPAQRLAPNPPLRAIDFALLLVAPESALTTAGQAADTRTL
jgi:small-conductance mechanosensitive channel